MASVTSFGPADGVTAGRPSTLRARAALDISAFINIFRRRWRLFAATVAVITLASVAMTLQLKPVFTASTSIKIDPTVHREINPNAATTVDDSTPDQTVVDTEVAIIRSRPIATAVVDELHLADRPEFSKPKVGLLKRLIAGPGKPGTAADQRDTAIGNVQGQLDVRREFGTYIVNVAFRAATPVEAAQISNAIAQAYIDNNLSTRVQAADRQSTWLNQQLANLGAQAEGADAAVARYKAQNGIATLGVNGQTVNDQQISEISAQLATAESDAAAARSNLNAARSQMTHGGLESVSSVLSSNVIADLRRQRAEVERNAADINSRYGPLHPEAIKVHQQLDSLDQQIRAEGQRIVAGLESAAQAAEARAGALRSSLGQLKGQQSGNVQSTVQADALQRQADARRLIYTQVAQSAQLSGQERRSQETRGRIVDVATPPGVPSYPNRRLFAVMGLLVGLVVAAAVVLLLEATDATVRTAEDVEDALGVDLVGSVPRLTARQTQGLDVRRPYDFVVKKPMSGFAEALRAVRSTLRLSLEGEAGGVKVVAITSALPNEGKTTTAASLARVMALSGEKVLLIDCDLRRVALKDLTSAPSSASLFDVLSGASPWMDALQADRVQGLDVISAHDPRFTPKDVLGGPEMRRLLDELRQRYDRIVLDAPPVLAVADARTISALADQVLLVVRWRRTSRQAAGLALSRLEGDGAKVAGVVLTMVDTLHPQAVGINNPAYYYGRAGAAYYQD